MQFENFGLFLSFVSYPFYKDGKDMYKEIFEPFFVEHKKHISRFDPDVQPGADPYPNIYSPAGYRLFCSRGLAILSLVDDYSFYNRFFNKNHIYSVLQRRKEEAVKGYPDNNKDIDLDFKSVVISGVTHIESGERTLMQAAQETFLLPKEKRFRYIGIIRLKIDFRLLVGRKHAMDTVIGIKKEIKRLSDNCKRREPRFDYLAVDCYDNDELTVVAFSDQLLPLFNFLGNIRSIKNDDIGQPYLDKNNGKESEKHVFGLTYLCFGYDLERGLGEDIDEKLRINCVVETKPGHRDVFYSYLQQKIRKDRPINIIEESVNISGGCSVFFSLPLRQILDLEVLCKNPSFRRDVRKIKISLMDEDVNADRRDKTSIANGHVYTSSDPQFTIARSVLSEVKQLMKQIGISKMVRERLMALYEFYNLSCQNILQGFYLNELKPALLDIKKLLIDLSSNHNEDLNSIELVLNEEITNLENACYDRLDLQKNDQSPLEYSGGIHQYLTSFDFAYKQIYSIFSPNDNDACFITISGAERASSERQLFKLNIHDIIFPELFITTVWKEIANFTLKSQKKSAACSRETPHKEWIDSLNIWYDFTSSDDNLRIIRDRIYQSESLIHDDEVSRCIRKLISTDLIEYFIKDYIVFHFAFGRKYQLFWHFYFKIFLQTTNCYSRINHIDKKHLINMLLRLFMVARIEDPDKSSNETASFLQQQAYHPYDSVLGAQWLECFNKVYSATDEIFNVLRMYGFCQMVNYSVASYEGNLYEQEFHNEPFNPDAIDIIEKERNETIMVMSEYLKNGYIVREDATEPQHRFTFIICLFGAYLRAVYELDNADNPESFIKCIPRDRVGAISKVMGVDQGADNVIYHHMVKIPVDTTGGFFIPSFYARKQYFRLRTALYRSMWNYRYAYEKQ